MLRHAARGGLPACPPALARARHASPGRERERTRAAARRAPTSSCSPRPAPSPAPGLALAAIARRRRPARLAHRRSTRRCSADGERGLLFEPGDVDTLAAQLRRLVAQRRGCASAWQRAAEPLRGDADHGARRRRARGGLRARSPRAGAAPAARRGPRAPRAGAADRRRPAHAHRPLPGLRDAGRGAARDRARAGPRRDRDHRPQRDLGRARGGRARPRGIKVIVGEEVKTATPGRGHRPVPDTSASRAA